MKLTARLRAILICSLVGSVFAQQDTLLPNVFFVSGVYPNIAAAYGSATSGCLKTSSAYLTCEIWDYNLSTTPGEDMPVSPWQFTGGEIPIHLRLGPGFLTVHGPLIVPRNSTIEGSGRAYSSAPSGGTVIQAASDFGGVGYITWTGGVGCPMGTGSIHFGTSPTNPAIASWSVDSMQNFGVKVLTPGAGYGQTSPPTASATSIGLCSVSQPSLTVHLSTSVVIIGDTNTGTANATGTTTGSSFGSRLVNLTVDCNNIVNCTGIELQNAQEQSGPMFVNVVNYSSRCLWVHGQNMAIGTDNSFAFQIECNGYYSPGANGTAGATMTFATVPVEFDNTKSRGIVGATVNPVNASTPIALTGIPSCTNTSSTTFTATGMPSSSFPSNWSTTSPPYGLSAYTTLAGFGTGYTGWNRTWPITVGASTFTINGVGQCFATPASGGTATLEPSADVIVCSGAGCIPNQGADSGQNNPTQVSLTQVHTEHAGIGFFITGTNTSVEILAPTTTPGGVSMYAGVAIDSVNQPAAVNITSQLGNGLPFMLLDGITGASIPVPGAGPGILPHYVSGTSQVPQSVLGPAGLQPPVIVTAATAATTIAITANNNLTTFDNTGSSAVVTYDLPSPVVGMTYTFIQSLNTGKKISIAPGTGVNIQGVATPSSTCPNSSGVPPTISSTTQYSTITIQAINPTTWRATSCGGTWTTP